jgi:hypothetical protein
VPSYTLHVQGWRPPSSNATRGRHWAKEHRLKTRLAAMLGLLARANDIPAATGKRRLSLRIVYSGRQKVLDEGNIRKILEGRGVCKGGPGYGRAREVETRERRTG